MSKLLIAILSLFIALAPAPASADSAVDFKGYYKAYYFSPNNVTHNTFGLTPDWPDSDNFFMSRLNIDLTFRPTDEITIFWQMRGPDKERWSGSGNGRSHRSIGYELQTTQIYGQVVQDWGTVKIGRMDGLADQGLTSLGYLPGSSGDNYIYRAPFDDIDDFRDAFTTA